MGLFRHNFLLLGLLFISSCSKKILDGHYSDLKGINGTVVRRSLNLNKDSTFDYNEYFYVPDTPGEIESPHIPPLLFIGKGIYTVNGKNLTLIFTSKIRKINNIEIIPILDDKMREKLNLYYPIGVGYSPQIIFKIGENSFPFNDDFPTMVIANDQPVLGKIAQGTEGRLGFNESMFPVKIVLNFGELAGFSYNLSPTEVHADFERVINDSKHHEYLGWHNPGYSCGFFDETLSIEKPGNYLVKLFFYKNDHQTKDQVISGKRIYVVKRFIGSVKIGNMKRTTKE